MKNGPIPLTTLKNVNVGYQSLQQHYDALKSAIDKLDKYKVNVDNCGFTECQKCQSCQSCQSCQNENPYKHRHAFSRECCYLPPGRE